MEEQKDMLGMLELIPQPSFFVSGGSITMVNQAARQLLLEPGTSVSTLLGDHAEEYGDFEGGCLCLTLMLCGCPAQASVTRINGSDLFVIDQSTNQAELRAMALTALGIREPLSDIMAIANHLLPAANPDADAQTREKICQMNRRLNQLHRIVCNMTAAVQYAGDVPPRMALQDICSVLAEIFERAANLVDRGGFRLTYSGPQESIICMICAERLERAIYNILSNAMKNSPAGSTIEARLTRKGRKLYLSIQDHGNGIPAHLLGSVHTRYRRMPGIESQPAGLGLGMVLIRGAATAHGGTVLIDQPKGAGTRVTISLTIQQSGGESLRSTNLWADYAGERDHGLLELSDVLGDELYQSI